MSTHVEQLQYPTTSLTEQLSCPVCTNILQRPIELSYGMIICSTCCSKWVAVCMAQRLQISCPCCHSHLLDRQSIRPPPPLILSLLAGVLVYCGKGCGKLVRCDSYDKHVEGNCQGHYHHQSWLTIKNDPTGCPCQASHSSSNTSRDQGSRAPYETDARQWPQWAGSESSHPWPGQYDALYLSR